MDTVPPSASAGPRSATTPPTASTPTAPRAERIDRVRVIRALDAGTGKLGGIVLVVEMGANDKPQVLAFSPDGKRLAIEFHPEVKKPTTFFAPLVVDAEARLNLNTIHRRKRLFLSADKDAHEPGGKMRGRTLSGVLPPVPHGDDDADDDERQEQRNE